MTESNLPPTLNRKRLVRSIQQQTELTNRQVEIVIDQLIAVMSEHLAAGGRVEFENFLTLNIVTVTRRLRFFDEPRTYRTLRCRVGKRLLQQIRKVE